MSSASSRVGVAAAGRAQVRAHARRELVERERLGHVVDRAGVEPGDAVVDLGPRGEHDHRQRGLQRAQLREHVEPVAVRGACGRGSSARSPRRARGAAPRRRRARR